MAVRLGELVQIKLKKEFDFLMLLHPLLIAYFATLFRVLRLFVDAVRSVSYVVCLQNLCFHSRKVLAAVCFFYDDVRTSKT